jgi:hypothetical protein
MLYTRNRLYVSLIKIIYVFCFVCLYLIPPYMIYEELLGLCQLGKGTEFLIISISNSAAVPAIK